MEEKLASIPLKAPQKRLLVMQDTILCMLQDNDIYRTGKILPIFVKILVNAILRKLTNL